MTRTLLDLSDAAAGARGSVFREGVAGAALHRAGLRAGLLRRQRADAVRARRVRLRDVHRRVHVHLDQAAVRRRDGAADRAAAAASSAGRGADRPHAQRADLEPVARPAAVAGRLRAICSRRSSRASSARATCSRTSSPAGRSICRAATIRRRSTPSPALTIVASRDPGVFARASARRSRAPPPASCAINPLYALEPDGDRVRLRLRVPERGIRRRIRRLPAVSARDADPRTLGARRRWPPARRRRRARRTAATKSDRRSAKALLLAPMPSTPAALRRSARAHFTNPTQTPRPAGRLRGAGRLGQDDAAQAVQDVAEVGRLRRRHDEVEFVGSDQADHQEPQGRARAEPRGVLAAARRRFPPPRRAGDPAGAVGRQAGDRGSVSLHRARARRRARPRSGLGAEALRTAALARPGVLLLGVAGDLGQARHGDAACRTSTRPART